MKTLAKFTTGFVAFFMLIPGLVKFTDPFKTFFLKQIELTQMPFPFLTRVMGQSGEIIVGLSLAILLLFWNKLEPKLASKIYVLANLIVLFILSVAIYVHFHPDVPAEILPAEMKFPALTIALIIAAIYNIFQNRKSFSK